eukprot:3104492-Rhodomonas_salina.4
MSLRTYGRSRVQPLTVPAQWCLCAGHSYKPTSTRSSYSGARVGTYLYSLAEKKIINVYPVVPGSRYPSTRVPGYSG